MLVEEAHEVGAWKNARVLAAAEFKRTWPSYLTTAVLMAFFGLVGVGFVTEVFPGAVRPPGTGLKWAADLFLLCMGTGFAYNWAASDYFRLWRDPFVDRLSFLKGLPVSVRELVSGRMLTMVLCLPVFISLFFSPSYVVMASFPGPFEPVAYLWFVLIWAGYGLLSGGVMLWLELGFRGGTAFRLSLLWVGVLVFVSFLTVFVLGQSVVLGTANLAQAHGPLPAVVSLLVGGAAFVLLGSATVRRLKRRELA